MKIYLSLFAYILLIQYAFCQSTAAPVAKDFSKLQWLAGDWNRINPKPGQSGHERWLKISDTELKGWGITMKGTDTAFVEKLRLMVKDNLIFYVAETTDNKEPVYFTLTRLTTDSFECENPKHDFPKKISYRHKGNTIKATISGNGKSIDYAFEKK
jgi:hypothetical protein